MSINVFTGLPATGKTSTLIGEMREQKEAGCKVILFLSSEHEEMTRRKNVKPGGLMGCRVPGVSFKIDHVCDTQEAASIIEQVAAGSLIVFDEAQFFRPEIVAEWAKASKRGINVMVSSPSQQQLKKLKHVEHTRKHIDVDCRCGARKAKHVLYEIDMVHPTHLCETCYQETMNSKISILLEEVKSANPFPDEMHTYQPFYEVDMSKWKLVREDSPARLQIILDAVQRSPEVAKLLKDPVVQPTFLDLGCCSGFFTDGMTSHGFRSSGVDVDKNFINWAERLAKIKGQSIQYEKSDAHQYITSSNIEFDVTSTFATIQWVMAQKDYDVGMECFKKLFEKTKSVAIVEMGYTTEDIYKDKINGAPDVIDKNWVLRMMNEIGDFAKIEVHHAGENGIWRDVFVGFREVPTAATFRQPFDYKAATQISNTSGYWEDTWVSSSFEVYLRAQTTITQLKLKGWRPEGSANAKITVLINEQEIAEVNASVGIFNIDIPLYILSGETFRLSLKCSAEVNAEQDSRDLAFILKTLDIF